jgi:hypothetical protein
LVLATLLTLIALLLFSPKSTFAQSFAMTDYLLECREEDGPHITISTFGIPIGVVGYDLEICDTNQGICPNGPGSIVFQYDTNEGMGPADYSFVLEDNHGEFCGDSTDYPYMVLYPDSCADDPQFEVWLKNPSGTGMQVANVYVDYFADNTSCQPVQNGNLIDGPINLCQCGSICNDISPSTYVCVDQTPDDPVNPPYQALDWDQLYGELEEEGWVFGSSPTVGMIISRLLRYIFPAAGLILLLFLLYGGFTFLLSGGDPGKIQQAKGILTNALIGFAVIFIAYWITQALAIILGVGIISQVF